MGLEARNISFRYGENLPWVLRDCSFRIERGERVALMGESGFGKTTLAMLLSGWLRPTVGEILLDGKPLPGKGLCPVQLILQHPEKAFDPRWRMARSLEEAGVVREELPALLGIEGEWLTRYPRELSAGELQRFAVARALTSGAPYLICDEISAMLDGITQAQLWNTILDDAAGKGKALLAITHSRALAERVADRIFDLARGAYLD